jgi:hypothetical protein
VQNNATMRDPKGTPDHTSQADAGVDAVGGSARAHAAPAHAAPAHGRRAYQAPRIERRIPVVSNTRQGPVSGDEGFFEDEP